MPSAKMGWSLKWCGKSPGTRRHICGAITVDLVSICNAKPGAQSEK